MKFLSTISCDLACNKTCVEVVVLKESPLFLQIVCFSKTVMELVFRKEELNLFLHVL